MVESARGDGGIDEAFLARFLAMGASHLADAPDDPVATLTVEMARRWAMWLARCPDQPLDVRAVMASQGPFGCGRLSHAVDDDTRTVAEIAGALFQGFDRWVHSDPIPAWIGPIGLLAEAEGLGPEAVLVGGEAAASLAAVLSERASVGGQVHAGPHLIEIFGGMRDESAWVSLGRHSRVLRSSHDRARRRHRSIHGPPGFLDVDRRDDERVLLVVDRERLDELHRLRPDVAAWPHLAVPELPSNARLLATLCGAANLTETWRRELVDVRRVVDAYATEEDADRVQAALARAAGRPGYCRHAFSYLRDLVQGETPRFVSSDEAAWVAEHAGSMDDLGVVLRFVEGLPGAKLLPRRRRRPARASGQE
jgi:hypothetical protein